MVRLGTEYGGWWFYDSPTLHRGIVVSAGAGEDISFDVALAKKYDSRVHIIDPTPRAIRHVESVQSRVGKPAQTAFVPGGKQPPDAYAMENIKFSQLTLHPFALWNADEQVEFFPPENANFVSYTVGNWRNCSNTASVITVEGRRLRTLLPQEELNSIEILKLDIEGSEIEVIEDVLLTGVKPKQLLVEFDQLAEPSTAAVRRAQNAFAIMKKLGYRLAHRERLNYSFILLPSKIWQKECLCNA